MIWGDEPISNGKIAHMSAEELTLMPAAVAINESVPPSLYMQRNMSMTSIEGVVPPLQLPSPNTFNELCSPWNLKSTGSVHGTKKVALDKAVDIIIEDCKTPGQGWGGGGIQRKYDTVQRGDLSRAWETYTVN